jgi:dienelactone hydrolase/pimeloyl-ACP methyl ester carboxylesterase
MRCHVLLRRCVVLVLPLALAGLFSIRAEEKKEPSPAEPGPRMLYDYLLKEADKHFDTRRRAVATLKTPEDLRRRQKELREQFLAALGGFPEKTPLKPRVVGTLKGEGFRVERVIYESRPDHHVTALLYLPEGKPPFPGVLMPCGHSVNGKAAEAYQRACILMAKNGLAVLCYDPIGQGERVQLLDRQGKPALPGSTTEHTMAGVGALLVGRNTATYRIWDGIRSLDYLASRPDIDPKRLGCTGNSGGGTLTAYLMALDERITAAAPSCYITSLERLFATIGPQDAEQNITGQVAFGMEHADYVTMRAPKPTLICTATRDFFDIGGAWTSFREAKLLYGLLGHGERVDLFEYNDKHGFNKPRRQAAMRWMRRWLLHKDDAPTEGDFPIFKDAQLHCTRTGQVLEDFKGRSVFDLNAEREKELAPQRAKFLKEKGRDGLLKEVRRLLALPAEVKPAKVIKQKAGRWLFETESGIVLRANVLSEGADKQMLLCLHSGDEGVLSGLQPRERAALLEHFRILTLEMRGTGHSAPRALPRDRPNYLGADVREAFLSLHLGRPLLGQRVQDVLAVIGWLRREQPGLEVSLWAAGSAAPVALHAAALDSRITGVVLKDFLASWSSVVRTPISHNQLCNVVPGVLAFYDLPDLAATLAPRPLVIKSLLDPAGKPLTRAETEKTYAGCRQAYRDHKAEDRFKLPDKP